MDEIGAKLSVVPELNIKAWNASSVVTPAAIVSLPSEINYVTEYGQGAYSGKTEIHVVTGKLVDEAARDVISQYLNTEGTHSVYQRVDSGLSNTYTTCHVVTVETADMSSISIAGVDYLDAVFTITFVGRGLS